MKRYLIVVVLLLQACTTEPKLQSQAIKIEVHPPLFERVWKNGKSELEGDRKIIRSEGRYTYDIIPEKSGKKDGTMRRYDKKSKKILFETVYKNGIHNGWARKYSPEGGWLYEETLYVNGSKDEVREYNKKGEMVHSTPYLNEKKHGVEQKFSYISGDLKYRLTHDHGTVKKLVTYCKGKPKVEMQFDGCRNGVEREWYCGTAILERETPYLNCKKNGLEKKYDKQGNLLYVVTYRNNLKEGSAKVYYPDGRIKYLLLYHNDKPNEMAWYYSTTNKKERIDYNTLQRFSERFPKGFEYWWQAL